MAIWGPRPLVHRRDWVAPEGTDTIGVISRATEEVIARVPDGTEADDIDKAVAAAREAFDRGPGRG